MTPLVKTIMLNFIIEPLRRPQPLLHYYSFLIALS